MAANRNATTITEFTDAAGRPHKVVLLARRLLLDLVGTDPPRVLALLRQDEGIEQARAIVFGNGKDRGYAERAKREAAPLCRALEPEDLRSNPSDAGHRPDEEWPVAA